jgi:hypothetical protein
MKSKLTVLIFLISFSFISPVHGQELRCNVNINTAQVQTSVTRVYESMKNDIRDFMNSRKWTNDEFGSSEKIVCDIFINITAQVNATKYAASIQVQSSRPIFNSGYNSPILSINDNDFEFDYVENTPLNFSPDQHRDNLTSVLAFYAYIIVGYDYDSFSKNGGTQYFSLAKQIVNNAQSAPQSGWRAFESNQNRYWIAENILNSAFQPFRDCMYQYHIQGLDNMYNDPIDSRSNITQALEKLKTVHQSNPTSYTVQIFFQAKSDEVVGIYSNAQPMEKSTVFDILQLVDPGNFQKYNKLKN